MISQRINHILLSLIICLTSAKQTFASYPYKDIVEFEAGSPYPENQQPQAGLSIYATAPQSSSSYNHCDDSEFRQADGTPFSDAQKALTRDINAFRHHASNNVSRYTGSGLCENDKAEVITSLGCIIKLKRQQDPSVNINSFARLLCDASLMNKGIPATLRNEIATEVVSYANGLQKNNAPTQVDQRPPATPHNPVQAAGAHQRVIPPTQDTTSSTQSNNILRILSHEQFFLHNALQTPQCRAYWQKFGINPDAVKLDDFTLTTFSDGRRGFKLTDEAAKRFTRVTRTTDGKKTTMTIDLPLEIALPEGTGKVHLQQPLITQRQLNTDELCSRLNNLQLSDQQVTVQGTNESNAPNNDEDNSGGGNDNDDGDENQQRSTNDDNATSTPHHLSVTSLENIPNNSKAGKSRHFLGISRAGKPFRPLRKIARPIHHAKADVPGNQKQKKPSAQDTTTTTTKGSGCGGTSQEIIVPQLPSEKIDTPPAQPPVPIVTTTTDSSDGDTLVNQPPNEQPPQQTPLGPVQNEKPSFVERVLTTGGKIVVQAAVELGTEVAIETLHTTKHAATETAVYVLTNLILGPPNKQQAQTTYVQRVPFFGHTDSIGNRINQNSLAYIKRPIQRPIQPRPNITSSSSSSSSQAPIITESSTNLSSSSSSIGMEGPVATTSDGQSFSPQITQTYIDKHCAEAAALSNTHKDNPTLHNTFQTAVLLNEIASALNALGDSQAALRIAQFARTVKANGKILLNKLETKPNAIFNELDAVANTLVNRLEAGTNTAVAGFKHDVKHLDRYIANNILSVFKIAHYMHTLNSERKELRRAILSQDANRRIEAIQESSEQARVQSEKAAALFETIKNMPWPDFVEHSTAIGIRVLLEGLTIQSFSRCLAIGSTQFQGCMSKVNKVSEAMIAAAEGTHEPLANLAVMTKVIAEEGPEVGKTILKTLESHPELLNQPGKSTMQVVQETMTVVEKGSKGATIVSKRNFAQENGKAFEDLLVQKFGGKGSFKARGNVSGAREFDGAVGNVWYEAKSGKYWDMLLSSEEKFGKFRSDMGDRLRICRDHGATYELHSNTSIPQPVKDWLNKQGIPFTEWK